MQRYKGDMHIHSVLSPCGDLEMSPSRIVERAKYLGLDFIAVCDHNHSAHVSLAAELGASAGLWVVFGCEVNTREEVHCLVFFEMLDDIIEFQKLLDDRIIFLPADGDIFGSQLIVNEQEQITGKLYHSLFSTLDLSINELEKIVHEMEGLFIPAHVDRNMNGLYAQLGIFPQDLTVDAVEIYWNSSPTNVIREHPELKDISLIKNSDAHFINDIGRAYTEYEMEGLSFNELRKAFSGEKGRRVLS